MQNLSCNSSPYFWWDLGIRGTISYFLCSSPLMNSRQTLQEYPFPINLKMCNSSWPVSQSYILVFLFYQYSPALFHLSPKLEGLGDILDIFMKISLPFDYFHHHSNIQLIWCPNYLCGYKTCLTLDQNFMA